MIGTSQVIQAHEFLGGALKHVYTFFNVYPYLGKWSNLSNAFQMGSNHQLDLLHFPLGQLQWRWVEEDAGNEEIRKVWFATAMTEMKMNLPFRNACYYCSLKLTCNIPRPETEKSPKKKSILLATIFSLVVSVSGSIYIYWYIYIDISDSPQIFTFFDRGSFLIPKMMNPGSQSENAGSLSCLISDEGVGGRKKIGQAQCAALMGFHHHEFYLTIRIYIYLFT